MKKFKIEKGITLIALIVTIVVILTLVAITINVALNGGLFGKARSASEQTQVEADKESLLMAAMGCLGSDGKIVLTGTNGLDSHLPTGFSGSNGRYTKGEYVFTVDANTGKITATKSGGSSSNLTELEKYILGEDGQGRMFFRVEGETIILNELFDVDALEFLPDPNNASSQIYNDIKLAYVDDDDSIVYIRYGRDIYSFCVDDEVSDNGTPDDDSDDIYSLSTVAGSLNYVRTPTGNLGKYVSYNNNTWIVLSDDANGVELISANTTGSVNLGGNSSENAKASYNNIVSTLVTACGGTGLNSIRSVGGPAVDSKTMDNTIVFNNLTTFTPLQNVTFEDNEGTTNGIKEGDSNYSADYNKMKEIGILVTDTPNYYWLASRLVYEDGSEVGFKVRIIDDDGMMDEKTLFYVYADDTVSYDDRTYDVRPIINLSAGALNGLSGDGTRTNPFAIE